MFPCDCCGEGLYASIWPAEDDEFVVLATDKENEDWGYFTIDIGFWGCGHCYDRRPSWKSRLRQMWYIWKHGHPWRDMVSMKTDVAKGFAFELLSKARKLERRKNIWEENHGKNGVVIASGTEKGGSQASDRTQTQGDIETDPLCPWSTI